jgi:hypothetical protein
MSALTSNRSRFIIRAMAARGIDSTQCAAARAAPLTMTPSATSMILSQRRARSALWELR